MSRNPLSGVWAVLRRWSLRGRFPFVVAGAAAASLVWLLVVTLTALTPGEAGERRAAPHLPIPSVPVERTELRQVSWTECSSSTTSVPVVAYGVPAGYRPVVTSMVAFGVKATTGRVLVSIAGRPVVAVATDIPLYRDFTPGTRGKDVRGFEEALVAAGLIGSADDVIDAGTLAAWHEIAPGGDRIVLDTIAQVPAGARVGEVAVNVGDVVVPGDVLMQVSAAADYYVCPGLLPGADLAVGEVLLEVDGSGVEVDSLMRTDEAGNEVPGGQEAGDERDEAGSADGLPAADPNVVQVRPKGGVKSESARLGVVSADSGGPVLAVPVTAIKTDAGGQPVVVVVVDGTSRRNVVVKLGASAQGLVEIDGEGLREGDRVEVFGAAVGGDRATGTGG